VPLGNGKSILFQLHYIYSPGIAVFGVGLTIWACTKKNNATYSRTSYLSNHGESTA